MVSNTQMQRGQALRIAMGITMMALLLAGSTSAATIIVPTDYAKLQWAIDNATSGDTIEVRSGTYFENVNVSKQLTLRGISQPVVDANGNGSAITLAADGIRLEGFMAIGAGLNPEAGIAVTSNNNTLMGNNASNNYFGIHVESSNNNTLIGNNASNNDLGGIYLGSSSNNTLSGNNASNNGDVGISLSDSSDNNTLSGNSVSSTRAIYYGSGYGINLGGSNNTLIGNNVSNNQLGIFLSSSSKSIILKNNIMKENRYNFGLWEGFLLSMISFSGLDNQIDTTNLVDGKPVYFIKGARDTVYDSDTNAGTFYCISCVNVTLKNLDLQNNGIGIFFWNTTLSKIQNVSASNNWNGISLYSSSKNALSGNDVSSNCGDHGYGLGISLSSSSNNTLSSNNVVSNCYGILLGSSSDNNTLINNNANSNMGRSFCHGIGVEDSSSNTLSGNNALDNQCEGIYLGGNNNILIGNNMSNNGRSGILLSSVNNLIYNNIFNNFINIQFDDSKINTWNITKQSGANILEGPFLGGNFWANPSGTGFGQICSDVNNDGICDSAYELDSNNTDYLPLTFKPPTTPSPTPTPTPTSTLTPEVATWDSNHDNIIQKSEAIAAVMNYFSGGITKANAIGVVAAFFRA